MPLIIRIPHRLSLLTLGLLVALPPCALAAGPYRNTVQTHSPFAVRLTQKNANQPLFVVTSDGHSFTEARLVQDGSSPMVVDFSVKCKDGYTEPFSGDVWSPGRVTDVHLVTSAYHANLPELDDWDDLFFLLLDALSGMQGVEGEYNLLSQGPDGSHIRSLFNGLKPAAIDACNDALQAKMAQGHSRTVALQTIGTIEPLPQIAPDVVPARLRARCDYDVFSVVEGEEGQATHRTSWDRVETNPLSLRLPVRCKSPFRPPRPGADGLTQGFAVQSIELAPERNPYRGECPLTVRLSGEIRLTGPGQVRYRYRTGSGGLGAPGTVRVTDGRLPVPLKLDIEVGRQPTEPGFRTPPPGGSGSGPALAAPAPTGDPAGPTFRAGAPTPPPPGSGASGFANAEAPGEVTDWVRVEILEPTAGVQRSDEVFYKAICVPKPPAERGLRTAPPPDPGRFTARQPAPQPTVPRGVNPQPPGGPPGAERAPSPAPPPPGSKRAPSPAPPPARQPAATAPAGPRPDLVLASVGAGRNGDCRFVVANTGGKPAPASALRLTARGRPPLELALPAIPPRQRRAVLATLQGWGPWEVSLDHANAVGEADEGNNGGSGRGCQLLSRR